MNIIYLNSLNDRINRCYVCKADLQAVKTMENIYQTTVILKFLLKVEPRIAKLSLYVERKITQVSSFIKNQAVAIAASGL